MDNALEPVKELHECKAIKTICEDKTSSPYKMILFQGTEGPQGKENMLYHILAEIAKREFFLKMETHVSN